MQSIFGFYPTTDFSLNDKIIYLRAVAHSASSDGFSDEEKEVFYLLSDNFGVARDVSENIAKNPDFDLNQFQGKEVFKVFAPFLLRDCSAVSFGDYELSDEERQVILALGEELMINKTFTEDIINAVINQMNAFKLWSGVIRVGV